MNYINYFNFILDLGNSQWSDYYDTGGSDRMGVFTVAKYFYNEIGNQLKEIFGGEEFVQSLASFAGACLNASGSYIPDWDRIYNDNDNGLLQNGEFCCIKIPGYEITTTFPVTAQRLIEYLSEDGGYEGITQELSVSAYSYLVKKLYELRHGTAPEDEDDDTPVTYFLPGYLLAGTEGTDGSTPTNDVDNGNVEEEVIDREARLLAAAAYGESDYKVNDYNEMAAIASVIFRQKEYRGYSTFTLFFENDPGFVRAASGENERFKTLRDATAAGIRADEGMNNALKAARNAIQRGHDYSNGACFWDGKDIENTSHPKVVKGILITGESHKIYNIKSVMHPDAPVIEYYVDEYGNNTSERGRYNYTYESTAAHGGTIFWKFTDNYKRATGSNGYY